MTIEELALRVAELERNIQDIKVKLSVAGIEKDALAGLIQKLEASIEDMKAMFHDSRELILLHERSVQTMEDQVSEVKDMAKASQKVLNKIIGALMIIVPVGTFLAYVARVFIFGG